MADTDQYTPRIGKRGELAKYVRENHLEEAKAIGLTEDDLTHLTAQSDAAREADRQQRTQLAEIEAERSERSLLAQDIFEREEQMRDRLIPIVHTLVQTQPQQGRWLKSLTFARYRMREIAVPEEELANNPEAKKVIRVEREDIPTRLANLANFCTSILEPGREPIIEAFAARALPREEIEALAIEADALAKRGRNVMKAAEATAREAVAVKAVREHWALTRRMFRRLVKVVNDPELTAMLAEC